MTKWTISVPHFRAEARKLGTALLIAGIAGGEIGEIGGVVVPPHLIWGIIATGMIAELVGLIHRKQEVSK